MIIFIKNLRGDKTEVQIEASDTILSIKQRLQELQGHQIDLQKLILAGKILEDSKTAGDSGIVDNSTLVLMVSKPKAAPAQPAPQIPPPVPQVSAPQVVPPMPSSSLPVPSPQNSVPESVEGPSALLTGEALASIINNIVDMGFERKQVEAAMKAAFNNPDRAIEYLTTGIPESRPQPASGDQQQLRELMQDPHFAQLAQVIQQNPSAIGPIMQQLQQSNPNLYNLIVNNRETFLQMMQEPPQSPHINPELIGRLPRPPAQSGGAGVTLTPQEQEHVKSLIELGFSRIDALEAYLSCDKNYELAASMLLENYQPSGLGDFNASPDRDDEENL